MKYETNHCGSIVIVLVEECWFDNIYKALAWFNDHNPARMRSVNLLEMDRGNSNDRHTEYPPDEKWAIICRKLQRVLRQFNRNEQFAFERRYFGERCRIDPKRLPKGFKPNPDVRYQLSFEEIASELGWDLRTTTRRVREVLQAVERAFMNAGIIPKDFDA